MCGVWAQPTPHIFYLFSRIWTFSANPHLLIKQRKHPEPVEGGASRACALQTPFPIAEPFWSAEALLLPRPEPFDDLSTSSIDGPALSLLRGTYRRGNSCRLAPRSGRESRLQGGNDHGPPGRDGLRAAG
jgi:hypothetical protein